MGYTSGKTESGVPTRTLTGGGPLLVPGWRCRLWRTFGSLGRAETVALTRDEDARGGRSGADCTGRGSFLSDPSVNKTLLDEGRSYRSVETGSVRRQEQGINKYLAVYGVPYGVSASEGKNDGGKEHGALIYQRMVLAR